MTVAVKKKNFKYWLNTAIVVLLMFAFGQLPPVGLISPVGMQILGIFLGLELYRDIMA